MTDRARVRVGRQVAYYPTSAEETAGGGPGPWSATVGAVLSNGTANLHVIEYDGTVIAKTGVSRGERAGEFEVIGLGPKAP